MSTPFSPRVGIVLLAGMFAACSDAPEPTAPFSTSASSTTTDPDIPTRAEENPGGWTSLSNDELWQYITRTDTTMVVGLRAPGASRGVWRSEVLLNRSEWRNAHLAVVSRPGVTLVATDDKLPAIRIRLTDPKALAAIRRLPIVDYLEPTHIEAVGTGLASDCGDGGAPWTGTTRIVGGDLVHQSFKDMGIEMAWKRSSGAGITVGLIDTGLSINQPELMNLGSSTQGFTSGESTGRFIETATGYDASCSHGTRMAGVIAAPKNGVMAVGVAWKANLAEYHHANDVWGVFNAIDGWNSAYAVRWAGGKGAKVISMAFQTSSNHSYLADEIRWWYYNTQVLFIGATGTGKFRWNETVFPAQLPEVFAVTGADYGNPNDSCFHCFYSSKTELAAYINQATQGMQPGTVTDIKGSSVATAVVAGVAALIYARYPGITRAAVVNRLRQSGHRYPNPNARVGYGVVNAMKALGGLYAANAGPAEDIMAPEGGSVTATFGIGAYTGDSPGTLEYAWNGNNLSQFVTYEFAGPPYGEMVEYRFSWSVKDLSDGNVISGTKVVRVWGCAAAAGSC